MTDSTPKSEPEALLGLLVDLRKHRRPRGVRRSVLVTALLALAVLVAVNVVVWTGAVHVPGLGGHSHHAPRAAAHPAPHPVPATTVAGAAPTTTTANPAPVVPAAFSFRLTAARGACWVSIRSRDAGGPVLYEGVLRQGQTARVRGTRLWARFGAIGNLDLFVNGKAVRAAHSGTLDAVVTAAGLG
ncbi:MAG TPA: DUF4115 domain-containing protein [Gaiellaceae bacterium]|jgi:hypothetical protein